MSNTRQEEKTFQRYHTGFATTEQAAKDKSILYSDHLPLLTEIPIANETLKLITWNLQLPNVGSGFDVKENALEEIELRCDRLIESMAKLVDTHQPHALLIQEDCLASYQRTVAEDIKCLTKIKKNNPDDPSIIAQLSNLQKQERNFHDKLITKLGANWEICSSRSAPFHDNLIIINKNHLTPIPQSHSFNLPPYAPEANGPTIQTQLLNFAANSKSKQQTTIMLHNLHLPHREDPNEAENLISALLTQSQPLSQATVIGGDFNNRYAPLAKDYLPNNVVPSKFRDSLGQGTDWTDGFFYMDSTEDCCHQPQAIYTLNPETAEKYSEIKCDLTKLNEFQRKELNRQRPLLSCAAEYQKELRATFELDEKEAHELRKLGIRIGYTADAFNSKKPSVYYQPSSPQDKLKALKLCLNFLEHASPIYWNYFAEKADCIEIFNSLSNAQLSEKKEESIFSSEDIKQLLDQANKECDQYGLKENALKNDYFKTCLLLSLSSPKAQRGALQLTIGLIETAPDLAFTCLTGIKKDKLSPEHQFLLARRIIIATALSHRQKMQNNLNKAWFWKIKLLCDVK